LLLLLLAFLVWLLRRLLLLLHCHTDCLRSLFVRPGIDGACCCSAGLRF
jgi:hypothetical protein